MKKQLLILGTGFGGFSLMKGIRSDLYDVTVVSTRNHFLFTPLLPSTTVGTIEFRSIIEPVRLARKDVTFYQAGATTLHPEKRTVTCRNIADAKTFELHYDTLVIAVGAVNNTFKIPGVAEYAYFLKELRDARRIRQRIIDNFERASTPGLDAAEMQRRLHIVVVGGGPTGVEFAAEMADFLEEELEKGFPHLVGMAKITLIEAGKQILSAFDHTVSEYAIKLFNRRRVTILTGKSVKEVTAQELTLHDGTQFSHGLVVWSTGNGPTDFVQSLSCPKDRAGRLLVDSFFRVKDNPDIYALGDCATTEEKSLIATAQVANQGGKYLANYLNQLAKGKSAESLKPFVYKHLGMLAYIGDNRAVADFDATTSQGFATWIFWRSAYLTKLVSLKNKAMVLFDWAKAFLFGRDVSRF
ncbi:MAG TPA: FAD-dependent oxidoreductase [bacterium]|nr:FAD-dependent oxidoreductase [bacterium]